MEGVGAEVAHGLSLTTESSRAAYGSLRPQLIFSSLHLCQPHPPMVKESFPTSGLWAPPTSKEKFSHLLLGPPTPLSKIFKAFAHPLWPVPPLLCLCLGTPSPHSFPRSSI